MNSENVIYNEADFIIPEDLELAIWDETYGNDEVIEVPYYAHVPKNIDVFSLQNEEEMCIVCRDSPRTHALIPWGHKVMCIDCVPNYNMNGVLFIVQSLQLKKHKKKLYSFTKNMVKCSNILIWKLFSYSTIKTNNFVNFIVVIYSIYLKYCPCRPFPKHTDNNNMFNVVIII